MNVVHYIKLVNMQLPTQQQQKMQRNQHEPENTTNQRTFTKTM